MIQTTAPKKIGIDAQYDYSAREETNDEEMLSTHADVLQQIRIGRPHDGRQPGVLEVGWVGGRRDEANPSRHQRHGDRYADV